MKELKLSPDALGLLKEMWAEQLGVYSQDLEDSDVDPLLKKYYIAAHLSLAKKILEEGPEGLPPRIRADIQEALMMHMEYSIAVSVEDFTIDLYLDGMVLEFELSDIRKVGQLPESEEMPTVFRFEDTREVSERD